MKNSLIPFAVLFLTTSLATAQSQWLDLAPKDGAGNGKKVVIVTGDESRISMKPPPPF